MIIIGDAKETAAATTAEAAATTATAAEAATTTAPETAATATLAAALATDAAAASNAAQLRRINRQYQVGHRINLHDQILLGIFLGRDDQDFVLNDVGELQVLEHQPQRGA